MVIDLTIIMIHYYHYYRFISYFDIPAYLYSLTVQGLERLFAGLLQCFLIARDDAIIQLLAGKCTNCFLSGEEVTANGQGKHKQTTYNCALELSRGRKNNILKYSP